MSEQQIIATEATGEARVNFLGSRLNFGAVEFEHRIFNQSSQWSDYNGGMWDFMTLSNGGFYMRAPEGQYKWKNDDNYSEGEVSADALGIIVSLYAFSIMSFHTSEYGEYYMKLREFANNHEEAQMIFAAID